MKEEVLSCIMTRRSVREFQDRSIPPEMINDVLEAARWAPSGHNNQPWSVIIVRSKKKIDVLAELSGCRDTVRGANVLLVVFLDGELSYERTKDVQSCGAFCYTALLATHAIGLGGVWVGRILSNSDKVSETLKAPPSWELMAVLCIGWPVHEDREKERRPLDDFCHLETSGQSWNL